MWSVCIKLETIEPYNCQKWKESHVWVVPNLCFSSSIGIEAFDTEIYFILKWKVLNIALPRGEAFWNSASTQFWDQCHNFMMVRFCTGFTALFTNTQTLKFKSRLHNSFFATVNHNYDHKQWTLKHRNTQNGSKSTNHRSQTLNFWTQLSKVLFPKRSLKMIGGSEKRKRQLVF